MDHDMSLPMELAEPILVTLLRFFALPAARGSSSVVCPALNTLSRALVPDVTRAALVKLWWYSLDDIPSGSASWLLPMLLHLEQRYDRPLLYSATGLGDAARRGDFATMDAWHAAGLLTGIGNDGLYHARHEAAHGRHLIQVLDWWSHHGLSWNKFERDIYLTSCAPDQDIGVQALEWWHARNRVAAFNEVESALMEASRRGFVRVLDWWYEHFAHRFELTANVINEAVRGGHLHVLQWWVARFPLDGLIERGRGKKPKMRVILLQDVAESASMHGHVDILQWWFGVMASFSKSHHKYPPGAFNFAAHCGHVAVLEFWLACSLDSNPHRQLPLKHYHPLNGVCVAGHMHVLEWFSEHKNHPHISPIFEGTDPHPFSPVLFHENAHSIPIACLDWRIQHGIPTQFSAGDMDALSSKGRLDILDWIVRNQIKYQVNEDALSSASAAGHVHVLDWWLEQLGSKELHRLASTRMGSILSTLHVPVLDWWADRRAPLQQVSGSRFLHCRDVLAWAIRRGQCSADAAVSKCIASCLTKGKFETVEWCLQVYPELSQQVLGSIDFMEMMKMVTKQGEFGIIEFLAMHELLPAAGSETVERLSNRLQGVHCKMMQMKQGLVGLDWIHKTFSHVDPSFTLLLNGYDVQVCLAKGRMGLQRWIKRQNVEVWRL